MSRVSRAMTCCFSGGRCSSVRILCRRSASLIRTTRTSLTMASSILRTFSAWRSSLFANWILSILVTPSTMCATCSPNFAAMSSVVDRRIFDRVVQQPGGNGRRIQLHLRQHERDFKRMQNIRLARGAQLAFMMFEAEFPGFADDIVIVAGTVGANQIQQFLNLSANRSGLSSAVSEVVWAVAMSHYMRSANAKIAG